jgi:hypothetical protein
MVEVLRPRRGIGEGAGQAPLRVAETRWCVFVGSLMPAPSVPFPARADLARVLISPARRDASTPIGRTGGCSYVVSTHSPSKSATPIDKFRRNRHI